MSTTKWLYQTFGVPLALAYVILLAKPLGDKLIAWGYCSPGNEVCTGGLGIFIFFGIFAVIGLVVDNIQSLVSSNIRIIPLPIPDQEHQWDNVNQQHIFRNFASLKVLNKENSELTSCYAVLKKANIATLASDDSLSVFIKGLGTPRLSWKNDRGDSKCEISIGPRTGEAILHIYQVAIRSDENNSVAISDFSICENKHVIRLLPRVRYEIEVELNGKLNGKDIRPISFVGFVDVVVSQTHNEISWELKIEKALSHKVLSFRQAKK